jgi:protocatechuate 3,4-dioxygenase beta subunit
VDLNKVRRNIVEDRSGVPLRLRIYVVDSSACKPIGNAAVDIWHCDALGVYSDESVQKTSGKTWLRGVQLTDTNGLATFKTIYPGHYVGRTTHIHVKVHVSGHVAHTGQLFFPDRLSEQVYKLSPYRKDTGSYQTRGSDQIYTGQHGSSSVLKLKRRGSSLRRSGLIGTITLGIDPGAT